MKLTWHIVRKDLTRLRLALALWAVTFAWEFALGVRILRGDIDNSLFESLRLYDNLAYALQVMIAYVLVAALVHEDPPVGTTAFWPTRPISPGRLLGAKLLGFVIIFGVLPAVLTLPWWIFCGYGGHEIFWAALDTFYLRALLLAVGFLVAALTRTMSWFLAGTFLIVGFMVISITAFMKPESPATGAMDLALRAEMSDARIWMLIWLALAGCSVVAVHQFLSRRLVRTLVLLGCVLGALFFGATARPLNVEHFVGFARWPAPSPPQADSVQVEFREARISPAYSPQDEDTHDFLRESFVVTGVPPGLGLAPDRSDLEWSWPDGTHLSLQTGITWWRGGHLPPSPVTRHPPPREWWEWMRAHGRLNGSVYYGRSYDEFAKGFNNDTQPPLWTLDEQVTADTAKRIRSEPPSFTADLKADLVRWEPRPEFALVAGNGWEVGSEGVRLARATWNSKASAMGVTFVYHHASIDAVFDSQLEHSPVWQFIISRKRNEEIGWADGIPDRMRIATVGLNRVDGWLNAPARWSEGKWVRQPDPGWFSDASVVSYSGTVVAHLEKRISVDPFVLKADSDENDKGKN